MRQDRKVAQSPGSLDILHTRPFKVDKFHRSRGAVVAHPRVLDASRSTHLNLAFEFDGTRTWAVVIRRVGRESCAFDTKLLRHHKRVRGDNKYQTQKRHDNQ